MEPIHRVNISHDCEWETQFIPWLDEKEKSNVGVEDGVFVATVDPALRHLQPGDENNFLRSCVKMVTRVSNLGVKHFLQEGIYETDWEEGDASSFKKYLGNLDLFKSDNCCTPFLQQDGGDFGNLFTHLDTKLNAVKGFAESGDKFGSSRSKVLTEESGLEMERLYNKYSQNTNGFSWDLKQKKVTEVCPDLECFYLEEPVLPSKKQRSELICYGYGLGSACDSLQITPKLNMSRIFNILWLLPRKYPGLHSSYVYFGDSHSFFPAHVEDALTLSLNYLHLGHPKIWVFIPPRATELLEFHLHRSFLHRSQTGCDNILGHKQALPSPKWLKARQIPFKVVVQRPGDLVVIYPSTAHFGFNAGPNIAQAINIGTKSWIPYGINAKKCVCTDFQIHIDISPLVAAFRKDLVGPMMRGEIIPTPAMIRGMQLLTERIVSSPNVLQCKDMLVKKEEFMVGCPAHLCKFLVPKFPVDVALHKLSKHASTTHRPILVSSNLLQRIEDRLKEGQSDL